MSVNATGTQDGCAYVMAANFSNEELTIPKAMVLGVAEEMTEELIGRINTADK
jgi:hypothetical protein